jgi:predicted phosphodiesterase
MLRLIAMRLGLLGPADGDVDALARAAKLLVDVVRVDRAIYLGADDALDAAVAKLASAVVEGDPSDDAAWARAARVAIGGSHRDIDAFVRAEEARRKLRVLERLPDPKVARTIEMVGDRVAVLLYDKGLLDEEDIFAASLLVYGKSDEPLVKKVGTRWFVTPGSIGCPGGGAAVLDDDSEEIVASIYDRDGKRTAHESIAIARATKMKVQGSL